MCYCRCLNILKQIKMIFMYRTIKLQTHMHTKWTEIMRQICFAKVTEIRYHEAIKLLSLTCLIKLKYINILHVQNSMYLQHCN